jgi:hypothetical protein
MILFYVKRGITRTHANPKYVREIILLTYDMYARVRINREGDKSGHTHEDTHCIDLDRSMHHHVSLGCDEDIHLVFDAKRAKTTKKRVCEFQSMPIFLLSTNLSPYTRTDRWWHSRAPITVSE